MSFLFAFYAFALGAIVGSFLNVVIHRYPREESLVSPPSRCPVCLGEIRWFDNIPIVSWIVLRGRCRKCNSPISSRYPLVELANALFFLALYLRTGLSPGFLPVAAILSMTIVLIYIDLDIQILPDVIDLPGIGIGMVIGALGLGSLHPQLTLSSSLLDSVIGALVGAGFLLSMALAYRLVRKSEGMGLGDVKMLAMIGAVVGWQAVIPLLFIASLVGAAFGISLGIRRGEGLKAAIPFGVFLGLATFVVIFFGPALVAWWYRTLTVV